jgi:two-component system OmpR family response regulator
MSNARPHLLVVDDDAEICQLTSRFLTPYGFDVRIAGDGRKMHEVMAETDIDLILLDIMLGQEDGLSLCRKLRQTSHTPVIFVTAVDSEADRVTGLEIGADDYVVKPFSPRELLARIRAVLRRTSTGLPPREVDKRSRLLAFAGWELDTGRRQLRSPKGLPVELSGTEYELLLAFLNSPQIVLTRDQLHQMLRGKPAGPFDRSIDVQIGHLRRKIEIDPKAPDLIRTVRRGGYVLTSSVDSI